MVGGCWNNELPCRKRKKPDEIGTRGIRASRSESSGEVMPEIIIPRVEEGASRPGRVEGLNRN